MVNEDVVRSLGITDFAIERAAAKEEREIERLGVGLRTARMNRLTAQDLAPAIRTAVDDAALRSRAASGRGR